MIEKAREAVEAMKEVLDIFSKMELPIEEHYCTLDYEATTAIIHGFQQLERERDEASEFHKELVETNNNLFAEVVEMQNEINALRKELEQVKRERDAAVEDLKKMGEFRPYCGLCAHEKVGIDEDPCGTCREGYFENNWQWRGAQEVE